MSTNPIDDRLKQLYSDLQRVYDQTLDRRKTLSDQAVSLLSFAGIIDTVLIGLILALATSQEARNILTVSPAYGGILVILGLGFVAYIATIIMAILAFRERMWSPAPQMPDRNPLISINYFFNNPQNYDLKMFAIQLSAATTHHKEVNKKMYGFLQKSIMSLMVGIILTAVSGLLILILLR